MLDTVAKTTPPGSGGAALTVVDLDVRLGNFHALNRVSVDVEPGEFVCLLGPSGCGKSTLLSVVGGFVDGATGDVKIGGQEVAGPHEDCGLVFQQTDCLFDWLTVRQNVEFGPKMHGVAKDARRKISDRYLSLVGLTGSADKYPPQLSGGMKQRVQLARVLANEPRLLLMDEPFGALDAQTRTIMQEELERIWRSRGCTVVFVTHDIDEALFLADRIIVMTAGPAAGIRSELRVDLPRPRNMSADVNELRQHLRDEISEEVSRSLAAQGLQGGPKA